MLTRHLDIGCGAKPKNPYNADEIYGVDLSREAAAKHGFIRVANLALEPIPFEDGFFDSVSAYDFLEHIPRVLQGGTSTRFPFIELMNEIWRALKNGGKFYAVTPAFPHASAFVDPTHVNIITAKTHLYFTLPDCGAVIYGFTGCFRVLRVKSIRPKYVYEPWRLSTAQRFRKVCDAVKNRNSHLLWEWEAVKPPPSATR